MRSCTRTVRAVGLHMHADPLYDENYVTRTAFSGVSLNADGRSILWAVSALTKHSRLRMRTLNVLVLKSLLKTDLSLLHCILLDPYEYIS